MKTPESVTDNNDGIKQSKRGMGWCETYLRSLAAGKAKISGPALEGCADYINSADDYIQQLEAGIDHAENVARECAKSITENLDKLQAKLIQVERERDAAVKIIEDATTYLEDFGSAKFALMQLKKWRGVCPEAPKEE